MKWSPARPVVAAASLVAAIGCAIDATVLGLNPACGDESAPCTPVPDAGGTGGADADAAVDVDAGAGVCPSGGSTAMVLVPLPDAGFCIDTTETTNAQYQAFLETVGDGAGTQPPECAGAGPHVPKPALVPDDTPVVSVNWCDAYAYCAWAGKRLCGPVGAGGSDRATEWYAACSRDGALQYPYGTPYAASVCNGAERRVGHTVAVGSIASCVGGYPRLLDMSGNVWEWEDWCTSVSADPLADRCHARGGGYASDATNLQCHADSEGPNNFDGGLLRTSTAPTVGFRCCASPLSAPGGP